MVKNAVLVSFLIAFFTGLIGIIIFPYYTINPGVVIEDHSMIKNDCLACHRLGDGAQTEKCIKCHQLSEIGLRSVNGEIQRVTNTKSNFLHNSIIKIHCFDCHTEHHGLSRENATQNFRHQVLTKELQKECIKCHSPQKPKDEIHITLKNQCSDCHNAFGWKPSHFKHEILGERKNECSNCHENKKPADELHLQIGAKIQCMQCHTTKSWKPSSFDHVKLFRFDLDHPSNCVNCHYIEKSFENYTCYNCHEHNLSRIEREHLKEGIRNFKNCVECHRSGDKLESHEKGKKKRRIDDD